MFLSQMSLQISPVQRKNEAMVQKSLMYNLQVEHCTHLGKSDTVVTNGIQVYGLESSHSK